MKSQESLKSAKEPIIPERYRALINRYPDILKQDFQAKEVKHGVVHRIETGTNSPCKAPYHAWNE